MLDFVAVGQVSRLFGTILDPQHRDSFRFHTVTVQPDPDVFKLTERHTILLHHKRQQDTQKIVRLELF